MKWMWCRVSFFEERRNTLKIVKIINNNIVTSKQNGDEVVVMGKGIGFAQEVGNDIKSDKIEKVFKLEGKEEQKRFQDLLTNVPIEEVKAVDEIVSYAKLSLGKVVSDSLYVALTDHIHFAIQRQKQNMIFSNPLEWEISHFYNHEYLISKQAIAIVKKYTQVELPKPEVATIAMHIVNAEMDNNMDHAQKMTEMIKQILQIIKYKFHVDYSETSIAYERLMTHLKFFLQRVIAHRPLQDNDPKLFNLIKENYAKEYECAETISRYVSKELNYQLSDAELAYLTIHINRVITEDKG